MHMSHLNQDKQNKYLDHEVVELLFSWVLAHDVVEQDTEQVREDHDLQIHIYTHMEKSRPIDIHTHTYGGEGKRQAHRERGESELL